jgi:hypothetical protein
MTSHVGMPRLSDGNILKSGAVRDARRADLPPNLEVLACSPFSIVSHIDNRLKRGAAKSL